MFQQLLANKLHKLRDSTFGRVEVWVWSSTWQKKNKPRVKHERARPMAARLKNRRPSKKRARPMAARLINRRPSKNRARPMAARLINRRPSKNRARPMAARLKTLLTNVVAEHVKSRMCNAKQGNGESVVHNKPENADVQCSVLLILYTSPYHIYKTILMAK